MRWSAKAATRFLAGSVWPSWQVTLCFLFLFSRSYSGRWTSSGRPATRRRCSCWEGASLGTCTRCCSVTEREDRGFLSADCLNKATKTKILGHSCLRGISSLHCSKWFLSNNHFISDSYCVLLYQRRFRHALYRNYRLWNKKWCEAGSRTYLTGFWFSEVFTRHCLTPFSSYLIFDWLYLLFVFLLSQVATTPGLSKSCDCSSFNSSKCPQGSSWIQHCPNLSHVQNLWLIRVVSLVDIKHKKRNQIFDINVLSDFFYYAVMVARVTPVCICF